VIATILLGRVAIAKRSRGDLTRKYLAKTVASPLEARTKYPEVDVFRYRGLGMLMGLTVSLLLTLFLMNWTITSTSSDVQKDVLYLESDIEVTPPQTAAPPPPPPPPPPPQVIEVPDVLVDDLVEDVVFIDQSIEAETAVEAPPPPEPKMEVKSVTVPPPPPTREHEAEEIFKVVEEMARFPGCELSDLSKDEKKVCAEKALYAFIQENLEYPPEARENNIQGTVVVQFVVNRDGTIQDITILRDIGAGCGNEVVRVVDLMNARGLRWSPGKQRGKPVRVAYVLPVKYTLVTS
jgi:protein TonB